MDGLFTSLNDDKSSAFILQTSPNDDQQEENYSHELQAPLLVSNIYENEFFDHFHMNYYGELEHEGLFLASLRTFPIKSNESDVQLVRILIRTKTHNYNLSEVIHTKYEKYFLQMLFAKAQLSPIHHYQSIDYIRANEKLLEFDKSNDDQYSTKVGFIYQGANETTENEMLSHHRMPMEMEKFLNSISDRVELKDFQHYRGDLDTKNNQHGIHSYFARFENHQIMFNVAPMIPTDHHDQDFIQRKSLIANALICIVFQEKRTRTFQPNFMRGKVTQVYITVQPVEINSELHYKIEIWRRSDIEPIANPDNGLWKYSLSFQHDFLTLILNTMNIILKKDFFQKRVVEQRQHFKTQSIHTLSQFFYSCSINHSTTLDNSSDDEILKPTATATATASKRHRHSFLPKILATFSSNRLSVPLGKRRSSGGHLLDDATQLGNSNTKTQHHDPVTKTESITNQTEKLII